MMAEPLAAALHGVAKHYHGFTLGPLNLEIPAGSIVGLIGENGAGKTTLLKLLTGVNRPDAGTVELLSATPDDAAVRAKIGVVFEDAYFYESLTPAQVGASLRGIFGPAWDAGYFAALLEQFHLPPKKSIKELSRGMRMKLNLASALAHRPGLLVLDEATSGLDPAARSEILDILLDFIQDERHSVLLSSHITTDLEQIADTIAYLHHGQLLFAKNKDDLMEEYGILRCSQQDLDRLPPEWIAATRRTAADYIYHESKRLEALSGNLLALMGLEQQPPQLEAVPLGRVLQSLRRALPQGSPVPTLPRSNAVVLAQPELLCDMLYNLIQNARKATPADGKVEVLLDETPTRLTIRVQDTGIPPQELARITEPFYMVDKSRAREQGGSGMGLALCARIAALHGTTLQFTSVPSQGTTVSFCLQKAGSQPEVEP